MRWTSIALALVPSVTARVAVDQDVATTNGVSEFNYYFGAAVGNMG